MRALLILPLVLLGLLAGVTSAQAQLTTLYSNVDGPSTVTGINSHPVGPSELGVFRIAAQFSPTATGRAQLLSMRRRCVVPFPAGTVCAEIGKVTLHEDAGGRPAEQPLGTMGFYLLEGSGVRVPAGPADSACRHSGAGARLAATTASAHDCAGDQQDDDDADERAEDHLAPPGSGVLPAPAVASSRVRVVRGRLLLGIRWVDDDDGSAAVMHDGVGHAAEHR